MPKKEEKGKKAEAKEKEVKAPVKEEETPAPEAKEKKLPPLPQRETIGQKKIISAERTEDGYVRVEDIEGTVYKIPPEEFAKAK